LDPRKCELALLRRLTQFATAQGSAVMIEDEVVLKLIKSVHHTAIIK